MIHTDASVVQVVARIDHETSLISGSEPEEHRKLRTGGLDDKAGAYGQYFGTWDIAAGMLRDFSMYALYPLLRLTRDRQSGAAIAVLADEFLPPYTNYLGYSGFPTLEHLGDATRAALRCASHDEADQLLSAYLRYANRLYSWVYHYFPWNLGEHFKYIDLDKVPAAGTDGESQDFAATSTLIRLSWNPLGVSVKAWLAVNQNAQLCQELLDALPFTVLQEHPMVTGESLFAWTPLTSTAPTPVKEEIRLAPIGRLRFSQRTGQKIIVQYGPTKETILAPVLGRVVDEDLAALPAVGRDVWDAVYRSKQLIWLTVERC